MLRSSFRAITFFAAVLATMAMLAGHADARVGGGLSIGSRGGRTFTAPPPTPTAPSASPFQRSVTQPGSAAPVRQPVFGGRGFFGTGMLGGFFAGFLASGLLGLFLGHGFLGGLGGFFSFLGLIIQLGLVALIGMLVWRYFQNRTQPAFAGGQLYRDGPPPVRPMGLGGAGGGGTQERSDDIGITGADYDAFERLLAETQAAYSAEDVGALRNLATPEMLSYFSEELARNASQGVVNRVSDVKLLQGDLAEAWREGDAEYATVAMRFSLIDSTVERASGRVVEGDPHAPEQASELWTFRRSRGGPWMLSAIQQAH
jgi:predicted lipid-binding transport protein (Tim44 family)